MKTFLPEEISLNKDNIKVDSREVCSGDIFIAVEGTSYDGHDFIPQALNKGAIFVLCERKPVGLSGENEQKIIVVEDTPKAMGEIAKKVYKDPSRKLHTYGVTGTNGKTTTVFLIDNILNILGRKSGFISTVFIKTSDNEVITSKMTTPDLFTLNQYLSDILDDNKDSAVIEISSHALDQKRVWGIELDKAVFTNITPEHLDYHKDMETYLKDKSKIFSNLKEDGVAILNADDPRVIGLSGKINFPRLLTFGIENEADVKAENISLSINGSSFDLVFKGGRINIKSPLIGKHNVYNILAAVSTVIEGNHQDEMIKKALESSLPVPGRLEPVQTNAPFRFFVDYAHTPNALENVLGCLHSLTLGKLICVFGCGGDRDTTKRPVMGKIAVELSDNVIVTSDNPRTEAPESIIDQIEKGMRGYDNYSIIPDRKEAIFEAVKLAQKDDTIIIAGKGHEDYQIIGDMRNHFCDKEIAQEALESLGYN